VIPLLTSFIVTAHPELPVDLAVVRRVQVHLVAVVALVVLLEGLVAVLAEAHDLFSRGNGHFREFQSLSIGLGGSLLLADVG